MQRRFLDASHGIMFSPDVHAAVVHVGHVEQKVIVSQKLVVFELSGEQERRLGEKFDDACILAVDAGGFEHPARQKSGNKSFGIAVIATRYLAVVGHVVRNLKAHKQFEGVKNIGKLLFTGLGFGSFVDFAGNGAIDNSRRRMVIAEVEFGDGGAKNGAVKLVERLREHESFIVDGEFYRREHFAESFVLQNLDKINRILLGNPILQVGKRQIKELLGKPVIGHDKFFRRIDLEVLPCLNLLHRKRSFTFGAVSVILGSVSGIPLLDLFGKNLVSRVYFFVYISIGVPLNRSQGSKKS